MERANAAFSSRNYSEAIDLYSTLVSSSNDTDAKAKIYGNRSAAHVMMGNFVQGHHDAKTCVELAPGYAKGWSRLGAALHGLKRYEEAEEAYKRAMKEDPAVSSYKDEAEKMGVLVRAGRGIASEDTRKNYYFTRAVNEGVTAMKEGKHQDAVSAFDKALDNVTPSNCIREVAVLLANRSVANFKLKRFRDSENDARNSIKSDAGYGRAYLRLGMALAAQEEYQEAYQALLKAKTLDPTNPTIVEELAHVDKLGSAAAKVKEDAEARTKETLEDLAAAQQSSKRVDDGPSSFIPENKSSFPSSGVKHTVSYSYCRLCSQHGHSARECPLRKRPR